MLQDIIGMIVPVKFEIRGYSADKLEYSAACPYCDGGKDRFRIWPNQGKYGRFWCRKCNVKGDGAKFVGDFLSDHNNFSVYDFINRGKARLVTESNSRLEVSFDKQIWSNRATEVLTFYKNQMARQCFSVTELIDRKITISSVRRFGLGYVANQSYEKSSDWGYPDVCGSTDAISIPSGILIPRYVKNNLVGLKVRMSNSQDGRRYHLVRGSFSRPILLSGQARDVICVVESELDGILLAQECDDLIDVCVLGSASAKIGHDSDIDLNRYKKVLVCLDNDHAAYKVYFSYWKRLHVNVIFWAPEMGKDVGEASKLGCDVRKWIEAGIVYDSLLSRR